MFYNDIGILEDNLKIDQQNSPEQTLAQALTKNYDSLSDLYPEFKRIKELAKLLLITKMIKGL